MAIHYSSLSLAMDDIDFENYKILIVRISLLLSIITMCVSLLLAIVASFISRDEDTVYVDLNINGGEGTWPKTYVYIQKDAPSSALQLQGKKISVSVDASMRENGGEEREEGAVSEAGKGNNSSGQTTEDGEKLLVFDGDPHPLPKGNSKGDELNPAEKKNKVIRI
ncbi:hypothetical protein PCYB_124200, partial [Plasmodium cynomolgi strain B]